MKLGHIFVPAYDLESLKIAAPAAVALASSSAGHIEGMHVISRQPQPIIADYYWNTEIISAWEKNAVDRANLLHTTFTDICGDECGWIELDGDEYVSQGAAARASDLIVVAAPATAGRQDADGLIEAIIVASGRPVMIIPKDQLPTEPRHIAIGWNGSIEASRAIAVARPLLDGAASISVISIGNVAEGTPSTEMVADSLRHLAGSVTAHNLPKSSDNITETLVSEAKTVGADTLLIGAYSHSRLRQHILGGVTRGLLRDPAMPVVMVH